MPHEYEDNEDREPPYNAAVATEQGVSGAGGYAVPVPADYTLRGYKSTAVMLDGHGAAVSVEVGWRHSDDLAGIVMLETKDQATADASTLLFVNQGDILDHVTLTGGGNIDYSVVESNQLPLAVSTDVGDPWPEHQFIDLAAVFNFGNIGTATTLVVDATMLTNHYLQTNSNAGYMGFFFKMGPRYSRHEIMLTGNKGPDFGIQHYELAWVGEDLQPNFGARNPVALLEDVNDVVEPVTWIDIGGDIDRYQAAGAKNITWGLNWRVTGTIGTRATAVGTDSDGYHTIDGGPGVYAFRVSTPTKNGLSAGYKAQWSQISVSRIDSGGLL